MTLHGMTGEGKEYRQHWCVIPMYFNFLLFWVTGLRIAVFRELFMRRLFDI